MSSGAWMKLKLNEITSPDEIRKNKENIAKLDEQIKAVLKDIESKNSERTENYNKLGVKLSLVENETLELKKQLINNSDKQINLEHQVGSNTKFINEKLSDIDERFNENKNNFRDNLSKIIDIQVKVKNLTEKSENTVDWGDQITSLQNNQKKLYESTSKYQLINDKTVEEIKNNMKTITPNLTSEIDKYYNYIYEDFEKLKDELGMKTNIDKNMSKLKNR